MQAVFRPDRPEISHHALDDNEIAELSAPNEKSKAIHVFFAPRLADGGKCGYLVCDTETQHGNSAIMKIFELLRKVECGDMTLLYMKEGEKVMFTMVPAGMEAQIATHRRSLRKTLGCRGAVRALGCDFPAVRPESLVQFKAAGDAYWDNFSAGCTMRNSGSVDLLKFTGQKEENGAVVTSFADSRGLAVDHIVRHEAGKPCLEITTSIRNTGTGTVKLEYLASFSLGLLSPFQADDGSGCYRIHRCFSNWSAEGRLENRSVEELNMEMSWQGYGVRSLRFGERGSMPVRDFFPFLGFEDTAAGVTWGAMLDAVGSWELEAARSNDFFNLSGGLTDREFGGWTRELAPGETLTGPVATVSCVAGSVDALLPRLVARQEAFPVPEIDRDLPVIFNDWCTTWGRPTEKNLLPIAETLKDRGIRYFMLDAGWFQAEGDALSGVGDWNIGAGNYPGGLPAFTAKLRERGFIPGVWFEFEVATKDSKFFAEHPELLLHLDGEVLKSGPRSFLDFRRPEVVGHLAQKVIHFLKENGFGYIKVDYNAPTGFGCDGGDSPAEELRRHLEGVAEFFRRMRRELPELVIEICSSGGHRLSPAWMQLGTMASFSDAHESIEIPIIAANTARMIPMRHNQIWAVLHPDDDDRRLGYSLAAGMLGRLCLSGEVARLDARQQRLVDDAIAFYRKAVPAIRRGTIELRRDMNDAWTRPAGTQCFLRRGENQTLAVVHTFADSPETLRIPLKGETRIAAAFLPGSVTAEVARQELCLRNLAPFTGAALLLE